MTPITPAQFEAILAKAQYDGRTHAIDMVVEVPAGVRAAQPDAHLVAWNNHTAESIRLEIIGGWPVVGVQVREKGSETALYGFGVANRQGSRFAQPSQVPALRLHISAVRSHRQRWRLRRPRPVREGSRRLQSAASAASGLDGAGRLSQTLRPRKEERLGQYRSA
ncbi:MAG: hypothetical protein IPJ94_00120 [Chloroflexi bacterium]|nr:hypothetical protein [Chloroflexota bacterium]